MFRRWLRDDQWQWLEPMLPVKPAILDVRARATDCSLRQFCGSPAPVAHGATCPRSSVRGTACTSALRDGRTKASGTGCSPNWPRQRTLRRCFWWRATIILTGALTHLICYPDEPVASPNLLPVGLADGGRTWRGDSAWQHGKN